MHKTEPFGVDLTCEKIYAGRVGAWLRQARYQSEHHWILTHPEHNRDGRSGGLGRE
jgi:hypothetical protein